MSRQGSTARIIPLLILVTGACPEITMSPLGVAVAHADPAPDEHGDTSPDSARIIVQVHGFRNETGDALFGLFRSADGFPEEPLKAARRIAAPIANGEAVLAFDVEPGAFAVSVLHDEDRNRELKTGKLGIPREGIGFSRDAHGTFGPPKFKNAKLTVEPGQTLTISIHMKYY